MARARLYLADGTYTGDVVAVEQQWEPNDTLFDRKGRHWRVVAVVESAGGAYCALLVVEPVAYGERQEQRPATLEF